MRKSEEKIMELIPKDSHKSFYRKAFILRVGNNIEFLQSYNTIVAARIKKPENSDLVFRFYDDYSATTQRHVCAFCGMNKAEFYALPLSDRYDFVAQHFSTIEEQEDVLYFLKNRPEVTIKYDYYSRFYRW